MTSRELIAAVLAGQAVPRVPTGPLAVHFCARFAGRTLRDYSTRAPVLADCVLRYYERFRPDAVWISADTWVSAEAMGARVGADNDQQPLGGFGEPTVRNAADLDRIPRPDPAAQGRYPVLVDALSRVARTLGPEVCIVGCFDQYPFSLAAALMGLEPLLLRCVDDPPFVEALMARCAEYAVAYATALGKAGADLLSGGDSPAGLLGPALYESIALPAERRVIHAIRGATGKPVSLHICGRTAHLLELMAASGATVLELDSGTPLTDACRLLGSSVTLWGNLDPVRVLAQGTPGEVQCQTHAALEAVRAARHPRFVLSSGCTLAVETPAVNLDAFFAAAR